MIKSLKIFYVFFIRKYYLTVLLLSLILSGNHFKAQTKQDIQTLRQVSIQSLQDNSSSEYQKYLDYYSKTNPSEALAFRIKAELIRGNYRDAVFYLDKLRKIRDGNDPVSNFSYHYMAYQISHILGIEAEAVKQKERLSILIPKIPIVLPLELAADSFAFDYIRKSDRKKYFRDILTINKEKNDYFSCSRIYYYLGIIELQNGNIKVAYSYFQNSELNAKKIGSVNNFEVYGVVARSQILNHQKHYKEAFEILHRKKNIITSIPDVFLKESFFKNYAKSASFVSVKNDIEWASERYSSIITENDDQQLKARSLLVDSTESAYTADLQHQKVIWRNIYVLIIIVFIISLCILIIRSRYRKSTKRIKDLEVDPKIFAIPDKTEKEILEKLSRFEASMKFTKNNISLKTLSLQLDTNPRYLSEIINKHKDSNFNTYINNLRIDYILKKLNEDEEYRKYKVSYLAEESGFSSHSLFTTTFKNKVGRSPIDYIKNLEKGL